MEGKQLRPESVKKVLQKRSGKFWGKILHANDADIVDRFALQIREPLASKHNILIFFIW